MAIRVLMVLDGDRFKFGPQVGENFTIDTLVTTLRNSVSPAIQLDTAHRRTDANAMIQNFRFDTSISDLAIYDEIWLIGDEGLNAGMPGPTDSPLTEMEKFKIASFMDSGGGMFATGDHDSIGSQMSGLLPRVRSMRKWFMTGDPATPPGFPTNWPVFGSDRADTLRAAPDTHFYFDSQSDPTPQPLTLAAPTHPILQGPSGDINQFPDHMHEGETISGWPGFDFNGNVAFNGHSFTEYPAIGGEQERPTVIATGTVLAHVTETESDYPFGGADPTTTTPRTIGTLSAYDGFKAGVGRVVTGSSFHHYLDINLVGDPGGSLAGGADTRHGFNVPAAAAVFNGIRAFYVNTAVWLARPARSLTFAVDRSTFGEDEVAVQPAGTFGQALFVIVDGLKPANFPGGGITTLSPTSAQLVAWAPHIPSPTPTDIQIEPTAVSSDDPSLPPRFQRFTFTYQVRFPDASAFGFPEQVKVFPLQASLAATTGMLDAGAQIELIKAADPFFDNLANANSTSWLSSDVRVFPLVEGGTLFSRPPVGSTAASARAFITDLAGHITSAQFDLLPHVEAASAISILPTTIPVSFPFIPKNVFNFALARVRLRGMSASASTVRVFFRLFQSQTTASLTYQIDAMGNPLHGFRQTGGPPDSQKIALPGISSDGMEYISVPCFAHVRTADTSAANNLATQTDPDNVKPMSPLMGGGEVDVFFGCLLDNNLTAEPGYLPASPAGQANVNGPFSGTLQNVAQLFMGAHQCLVAEIVYDEAPIINGATPSTSDKLAQRNIAFTVIANPGAVGSRMATHTFEIGPTQTPVDATHHPDELMIDWRNVPTGGVASIYLPAVSAEDVLKLAGKLYARHDLAMLDANTLQCPAGGITYIPIPPGGNTNHAGVFSIAFPEGIKKGERFDVVVRQISTTGVHVQYPPAKVEKIEGDEVARRAEALKHGKQDGSLVLYERVRSQDPAKRQAILIHSTEPASPPAELTRTWRRVRGTFQIAIPVDVKENMLVPEQRLLSVLRWIGQSLSVKHRWHPVFMRYLETIAGRVKGLGADPDAIPPTPTGLWPGLLGQLEHGAGGYGWDDRQDREGEGFTGKVDRIAYDCFGDFDAFILETRAGGLRRFESRERRIHDLVHRAWAERLVTTVVVDHERPHRVREIVLHYPR
jgi:hypothetical protein